MQDPTLKLATTPRRKQKQLARKAKEREHINKEKMIRGTRNNHTYNTRTNYRIAEMHIGKIGRNRPIIMGGKESSPYRIAICEKRQHYAKGGNKSNASHRATARQL